MAIMSKLVMLLVLLAALVPSYEAQGEEVEPFAYKQWVAFHITYIGPGSIQVMNAKLNWGKWYQYPNQDKELGTVNGVTIRNGRARAVAASGGENASSGTEGTIELYTVEGGSRKLVEIYFDCPWSGKNKITKRTSDNVILDISDWTTSGALGNINVTIAFFGTGLEQP